jgi:iron complex transport system substrate-binding protein
MRIVSLEPFITDTLRSLGVGEQLVGVSHRCDSLPSPSGAKIVTGESAGSSGSSLQVLLNSLSKFPVDLEVLLALNPSHVFLSPPAPPKQALEYLNSGPLRAALAEAQEKLSAALGAPVVVAAVGPASLAQVFDGMVHVAKSIGCKEKGQELSQRMKAQLMDWGDSFYERMKNKRVTFLAGVAPLKLGGWWIPDLINLASCSSEEPVAGGPHREVTWQEIVAFRPDVIIVAPEGLDYQASLATFKVLEKLPDWEAAPAVKRGEVFFAEGERLFHRPGPTLLEGMGVLVSAIAGIDSGYITKRDSFVRLRYLEMQRHRY